MPMCVKRMQGRRELSNSNFRKLLTPHHWRHFHPEHIQIRSGLLAEMIGDGHFQVHLDYIFHVFVLIQFE